MKTKHKRSQEEKKGTPSVFWLTQTRKTMQLSTNRLMAMMPSERITAMRTKLASMQQVNRRLEVLQPVTQALTVTVSRCRHIWDVSFRQWRTKRFLSQLNGQMHTNNHLHTV